MENEELTERLLQLEARHEALSDENAAHRQVLWKLLQLLHERGTLPLPDVIAGLRSGVAFGQLAFDVKRSALLDALVDSLQSIADALARPASPSP